MSSAKKGCDACRPDRCGQDNCRLDAALVGLCPALLARFERAALIVHRARGLPPLVARRVVVAECVALDQTSCGKESVEVR